MFLYVPRPVTGFAYGILAALLYMLLAIGFKALACQYGAHPCFVVAAWPFHLSYPLDPILRLLASFPSFGISYASTVTLGTWAVPLSHLNTLLVSGLIAMCIATISHEMSTNYLISFTILIYGVSAMVVHIITLPVCGLLSQVMGRLFLIVCPF